VSQCLVYINSKIDVDKKTGKQWIELNQSEIEKVGEMLSDTAEDNKNDIINDLKAQGYTDKEIAEITDGKSEAAKPAATSTPAQTALDKAVSGSTLTDTGRQKIKKELKYIAAAYAYSHPDYLQKWVSKHQQESGVNV
ncbi:MAG: hypothetical protein K2N48_09915, partial [Muribaculaceae bacterium]|nr:hypothetical protein [Muribaculaceae bacterium]